MLKQLSSALAIVITFWAMLPYIRAIRRNAIRPHVFSWIIWGLSTFVVFLAQLAGGAGIGAWPVGLSGLISLYIALLAYTRRGDSLITPTDWLFLVTALSALPLWLVTAEPLWAVVILTTMDLLGFGPTLRRAYFYPWSESNLFFTLVALRNLLVVLALEKFSLTTVLFPAVVGTACVVVVLLLTWRRKIVPAGSPD
jgi:hypothetical protein